ncbi:transposon Ty3-G Gag-Pol polyprotein [Elysia marginata]|uniref:Transposon Ty3-G Gag-Pol polyprotein n=1 Tax=Elysia marginata TaxID=1093978 RepID=A0AAV4H4M3_9GAST|nr:transposon Ty3-G Gag-Pol polyprotein [Elysia marginata]
MDLHLMAENLQHLPRNWVFIIPRSLPFGQKQMEKPKDSSELSTSSSMLVSLKIHHGRRSYPTSFASSASTGVSPHEALTGRKMKTSLSDIHIEMVSSSSTRSELAMKDFVSKAKQKEFADRTRKTQPHSLTVGDTVLVRQKKVTPPYIPKPYKVPDVKGSMITSKKRDKSNSHELIVLQTDSLLTVEEKEEIDTDTEDVLEEFPETHQQQYPPPHAEPRSPLPTRSPRATQARPRLDCSYSPHSSRQAQSSHSTSPTSATLVEQSNSPKQPGKPAPRLASSHAKYPDIYRRSKPAVVKLRREAAAFGVNGVMEYKADISEARLGSAARRG